jgi:ribose transport system ATP-binding protein
VTVLRNGRVVGTGAQAEFTKARLVELIVGGEVAHAERAERGVRRADGTGGLIFDGVSAGRLESASFAVAPGEVVGMAGLAGSGVHDVPRVLLGRIPLRAGSILAQGEALVPEALVRRRIAVLSSERGLKNIATMSVRENLTLPELAPLWHGGRLRVREERAVARDLIRRFGIRPAEPEKPLMELSGGNQQKVAVAKWLRTKPRLMVLDEPTQGVDVGGKAEILELLRTAAREGVGVLICSSDLEDLEMVCDRVLVVREGRVGGELSGAQITRERVSEECYRDAA